MLSSYQMSKKYILISFLQNYIIRYFMYAWWCLKQFLSMTSTEACRTWASSLILSLGSPCYDSSRLLLYLPQVQWRVPTENSTGTAICTGCLHSCAEGLKCPQGQLTVEFLGNPELHSMTRVRGHICRGEDTEKWAEISFTNQVAKMVMTCWLLTSKWVAWMVKLELLPWLEDETMDVYVMLPTSPDPCNFKMVTLFLHSLTETQILERSTLLDSPSNLKPAFTVAAMPSMDQLAD